MAVFGFGYNGFGQIVPSDDEIVKTLPICVDLPFNANGIILCASWSTTWALTDGDIYQWGWVASNSKLRPCINKMELPGYTNCKWTSIASPCSSGGVEKLLLHSEKDMLLLWLTEVAVVSGNSSHSPESDFQAGRVDLSCINRIQSIACSGEKVWAVDASGILYVANFPDMNSRMPEGHDESRVEDKTQTMESNPAEHVQTISFERLGGLSSVVQVACGIDHTIVLTSTGMVFSCGIGSRGQLGLGDIETHSSLQLIELLGGIHVVSVVAGGWHSLALTNVGSVYSWGWNSSGQLGVLGSSSEDSKETVGMFGALPEMVDFPLDCDIMQVACGSRHSAAVSKDGLLFTWGWGEHVCLSVCLSVRPPEASHCLPV
jgi:alpha-tubulin suppressor-like RCC1 family protein